MGQHSGTKVHAGTRGALQHREQAAMDARLDDELLLNNIAAHESDAREEAEESVRALIELRDDPGIPPNVRRQAANDILDRGFGKPRQRVQQTGKVDTGPQMVVNIIQFGDGTKREIEVPSRSIPEDSEPAVPTAPVASSSVEEVLG